MTEINPQIFKTGYCLEFAIELNKHFPDFRLALIGGYYKNEDYDDEFPEEDDEFLFEAAHAVLINPENPDFLLDVDGYKELSEFDCFFNNNIEKCNQVFYPQNIEEAESFLGSLEQEAQNLASSYINENILDYKNKKKHKYK